MGEQKIPRNPTNTGPADTLKETKWQAGSAPGAMIPQENSFRPLQFRIFPQVAPLQQVSITNCYSKYHEHCVTNKRFRGYTPLAGRLHFQFPISFSALFYCKSFNYLAEPQRINVEVMADIVVHLQQRDRSGFDNEYSGHTDSHAQYTVLSRVAFVRESLAQITNRDGR
ncbi:hypothetical protein [Burkholderia sp. SRS-W-2-2016]|uniref:hypothetical protein n=1 Tax=Burkholderia sp. SRS-W-2-2016 TaxID=1926878 RepID=UPI00117D7810|nr:hypothetical protein [Burkholderia sp. SRS-W-2-2016]